MPEQLLHAAEAAPEWDVQAQAGILRHLNRHLHILSPEQTGRYENMLARYRQRISRVMGFTEAPNPDNERSAWCAAGAESVF